MAFGDFTVDRNSTKYVLGSGGSYVSYATDEPAFEFNSDGSYKGLLVEPASTNEVRNGSATGSTNGVIGSGGALPTRWALSTTGGLTTEIIGTGTENGVNYIDIKASGTATGTQFRMTFEGLTDISADPSEVWTTSFFAKTIDLTAAYDSVRINQYYRNAAGTYISQSFTTITLTSSLARYELTGTTVASTERIQPDIQFNLTNGNSYDFTVRIGWVQCEESPIATSPIPTTSAAVTRVKDDITQTGAQSLIGQTEGTLYVEVDWRAASGTNQWLLEVSDSTDNNRMAIITGGGFLRMQARAGGDTKTSQGVSSTAYSGIQKIAFAYADNDFELYRNGSSIATDTTGSLASLATMTDIDLGQYYTAGFQANMHIRAVALYTRRLTDAEAQALTTL